LNRRIKAGDIIRRHDIHWVTMRRSQVNRNVIVDGDQLIGMTPKRFVPAGRKVRMGDIRHPRLIKKGAIVTMVLSTPKMVLTSKGRALEHGARGETIKVMNLKSKTVIEAEITGPNSVRINAEMSPSVISTARR
ncbi:MAG: flagellar basal body P-ring formation chaperone FlgA, partial [Alphaproteobacteria bacterium]|nr:flagellar basal body P-ring formation chaperone FlgA [Alphaproteobacteria bacterium]